MWWGLRGKSTCGKVSHFVPRDKMLSLKKYFKKINTNNIKYHGANFKVKSVFKRRI